jgi:hypothetical protein
MRMAAEEIGQASGHNHRMMSMAMTPLTTTCSYGARIPLAYHHPKLQVWIDVWNKE